MFRSRREKRPEQFAAVPAEDSAPAGDLAAEADASHTIYAARQPILDRQSVVCGYELLFRSGPENRYTAVDQDWAAATSLEQATAAFGFDRLVGDRRAYVNFTREALLSEYHRVLPRERVVVEILENVEPEPDVLAACRRMRAEGYQLALDDYVGSPESEPFLDIVHTVKADVREWPAGLAAETVAPLKRRGLSLLAEKVETLEEQQAALAAGYDFLQGYFFCQPQMVEVRDLAPSKLSVLRFLGETSRDETSFERLEDLFRSDVALTVRLLRYLNSAAFGWRHEVTSIRHALGLMGERPLRRWAMMLGVMTLCDDRPHELVVTALSRARFAERLGTPAGLSEHEHELFLAGMLSLVDTMVGRPAPEILDGLAVPSTVRDAVLDLVSAYERGDWAHLDDLRRDLPVDDSALDRAYVESVEWAEVTAH